MVVKSQFSVLPAVPDLPLHTALFNRVTSVGDSIALIHGVTDETMTYKQLITSVEAVACGLVQMGVAKGDVIVIYSLNSFEFIIMFLAISAVGGIAAPVNPAYKKDELLHCLQLVETKWLFTTGDLLGHVQAIRPQYSLLKSIISHGGGEDCVDFKDLLAADRNQYPNYHFQPKEDVVLILFSSGTTGLPKGVMLTHFNLLVNLLQRLTTAFEGNYSPSTSLSPDLLYLPLFHTFGLAVVLLSAIWKKTALVVLPRFDPRHFLGVIEKYKIAQINLVPPVAAFLAKSPLIDQYNLTCVVGMRCSAAPLSENIRLIVKERLKLTFLHRGYGLTEITSSVTRMPMEMQNKPDSIGCLVPDLEAKVIDADTGNELGPNQVGELCFRGPNIMKGYFNNKEATDATVDNEKWLHTGDLGYYDEDEYFYIVDRLKELIKYKAFQIAPVELENILASHPAVVDVAVIGISVGDDGEVPRAFVVSRLGHQVSETDLIKFVQEKVTSYKELRGGVEFVNEIPRNATGKILRRLLRDNYYNRATVSADGFMCSGGVTNRNLNKKSKL